MGKKRTSDKKIVSVFHRPVSNSRDFENLTWLELFSILTGPPIKLSRATAKEKALKGDYYVRGLIRDGRSRNDKNLKKSNIIIIDVDKAIEGFPKPSPEEIAAAAADINEEYGIPFVTHASATPGNSRVIFLSKPFKKKHTRAITRFIYQLFRDKDCRFAFAGESSTFSQPWFLPQSTKPETHFNIGIEDGKPFDWKKFVDLKKDDRKEGVRLALNNEKLSDGTALDRFLANLEKGTIHNTALSYMGWLSRTTDMTYDQIVKDTTTLIEKHYVRQPGDEDKLQRWLDSSEAGKLKKWFLENDFERYSSDDNDEGLFCGTDEKIRKVKWLWEGMFHQSKFNLLAGDSGSNKTTFCLRCAAHVTTGESFPDGPDIKKGGVLLLTAEDDLNDTILPRLKAVGADVGNFFYTSDNYDFNSGGMSKLQKTVDDIQNDAGVKVKMLIVDPIDSYTGNANTNLSSIVKKICNQFNLFARKNDLCFLGIMHFKKVIIDGRNSLKNAISGSYAWTSTPRSVLCMVSDPATMDRKYLGLVKNNNARIDYYYNLEVAIKNDEVLINVQEKNNGTPIEVKALSILKDKRSHKIKVFGKKLYMYMLLKKIEFIPCPQAKKLIMEWSGQNKKQTADACKMFSFKNIGGEQVYIRDSYNGLDNINVKTF